MTTLLTGKEDALRTLCKKNRVRRLELVGSAAAENGFNQAGSDVDFLVEFEEMTPREHAKSYLGMIDDLEMLFSRHVDLIEERAIRNPYFLASVKARRVPVYG